MTMTRLQKQQRKKIIRAVLFCIAMAALLSATTIAAARALSMADEDTTISEEYQMYLDSQRPAVPRTWYELEGLVGEDVA